MYENDEKYYVTMNDIRIFLLCAELSNFTKAAEKLNITAGMVSKRMRALEDAVGFLLFVREKNKVSISPAGSELKKRWSVLLNGYLDSIMSAKEISRGKQAPIVFGLGNSTNMDRYFIPLVSSVDAEETGFSFRAVLYEGFGMLEDLLSGKIDIMFAPYFMERSVRACDELECFLALPSPLYAGISECNPLASRKILMMKDLSDVGFVMFDSSASKEYREWLSELCTEKGFSMKADCYLPDGNAAYLSVNDSNAFITDKYYSNFSSSSILYREITDTKSGLLMIWRKDARAEVLEFVAHCRDFYLNLKC